MVQNAGTHLSCPAHTQFIVHSSSAHRAVVEGLCGPLGALGLGAAAPPAPSGALPEIASQDFV